MLLCALEEGGNGGSLPVRHALANAEWLPV